VLTSVALEPKMRNTMRDVSCTLIWDTIAILNSYILYTCASILDDVSVSNCVLSKFIWAVICFFSNSHMAGADAPPAIGNISPRKDEFNSFLLSSAKRFCSITD